MTAYRHHDFFAVNIWIWILNADRTSDWYRVSGTGGA